MASPIKDPNRNYCRPGLSIDVNLWKRFESLIPKGCRSKAVEEGIAFICDVEDKKREARGEDVKTERLAEDVLNDLGF